MTIDSSKETIVWWRALLLKVYMYVQLIIRWGVSMNHVLVFQPP